MPLLALLEEEVADDRADHRQAGRDAEAGEDRRQGRRELQLAQPRPRGWRRCSVNRSCWPRSADSRPNSVLTTIGKIAIITHTITRDVDAVAEDRRR